MSSTRPRLPSYRTATASCAFVLASSFATARADERAGQNIPELAPKDGAPPPAPSDESFSELPPPYHSWDGTGLVVPSPPQRERPLPLARPRELPRRPFELSAALTALLPSCGAGSVDSRGCQSVQPGVGADASFVYRLTPFFAVGVEAVLSGLSGDGGGPLSSAGGSARFGGVVGRLYAAEAGAWDPYASLTLGVGSLKLAGAGPAREQGGTSGLGARLGGGVDVLLGSHLRVGPSASFAHFIAFSEEQCNGDVCRSRSLAYGRLLGFATLGLRLTGTFGQAL